MSPVEGGRHMRAEPRRRREVGGVGGRCGREVWEGGTEVWEGGVGGREGGGEGGREGGGEGGGRRGDISTAS